MHNMCMVCINFVSQCYISTNTVIMELLICLQLSVFDGFYCVQLCGFQFFRLVFDMLVCVCVCCRSCVWESGGGGCGVHTKTEA